MADGVFVGLSATELATLKTAYLNCLVAIATSGQSYSISGRQFTRADIKEVKDIISELNYALARINPSTVITRSYPNFNSSIY